MARGKEKQGGKKHTKGNSSKNKPTQKVPQLADTEDNSVDTVKVVIHVELGKNKKTSKKGKEMLPPLPLPEKPDKPWLRRVAHIRLSPSPQHRSDSYTDLQSDVHSSLPRKVKETPT